MTNRAEALEIRRDARRCASAAPSMTSGVDGRLGLRFQRTGSWHDQA